MSWPHTSDYDIQRPTGQCVVTGQTLEPGQTYMAALVEVDLDMATAGDSGNRDKPASESTTTTDKVDTPSAKDIASGLQRVDISLQAWEQGHRPNRLFSYWRSTVPQPHEKKRMFVDDEVLMDLIMRLGDSDQPERLSFRFVLALILMRKKLLRYESSQNVLMDLEKPRSGGK